jgi:hypothetical protein
MNNKLKTVAIFITTCQAFLLLSSVVFSDPLSNNVGCTNSKDGKPRVIDNVLECDLRTSFEDKNIAQQTLGIVRRIDLSSDIRLEVNLQTVMTILGEKTITFPSQPLLVDIVMGTISGKEQVLPISMKVNPVLTKTGGLCDLTFVDFKPNVNDVSCPNLPTWVSQGIEKILNNDPQIREQMLKLANDAALQVRTNFIICEQ